MDPQILKRVIGYFRVELLAVYQAQPDKYEVESDYFTGKVSTRDSFYERTAQPSGQNQIHIPFGFHLRKDGDFALAAFLHDLEKASPDERQKWAGFALDESELSLDPDPRFELWTRANLDGDWDVGEPVLARIKRTVSEINDVTGAVVGTELFEFPVNSALLFPKGENDHAYQDAMAEAYKYLVDGLSKDAIGIVAKKLQKCIKIESDNTIKALSKLLPVSIESSVLQPFRDVVSPARRQSGHGVRSPAERFPAFEQFSADMEAVFGGLTTLRDWLAQELDVTVESCTSRRSALRYLPRVDSSRQLEGHYSIRQAHEVVGKKISKVDLGFRERIEGVHSSEVIILHFEDGSRLALDTGSNIGNLLDPPRAFSATDLEIRYHLTFIPPLVRL